MFRSERKSFWKVSSWSDWSSSSSRANYGSVKAIRDLKSEGAFEKKSPYKLAAGFGICGGWDVGSCYTGASSKSSNESFASS